MFKYLKRIVNTNMEKNISSLSRANSNKLITINENINNNTNNNTSIKDNSSDSTNQPSKSFLEINFENTQLKDLFVISVKNSKVSQTTKRTNYCYVNPTPVSNPYLIGLSGSCAKSLFNIDKDDILNSANSKIEFEKYFSGNEILKNSKPAAHCYVGYQFGSFAGQLGDGRAVSLGDFYNKNKSLIELQLKGSGLTPYSRFADGRAVLRSSIREYLASEHMHALGIPTTRALSIVGSEDTVLRDPFYNGRAIYEQACVVTRAAPTFMRFGSFEIFKKSDFNTGHSGPSEGLESEMLPKMLDYIIKFHYTKEFENFKNENVYEADKNKEKFKRLLELVCERTALLAAYWQAYGFCHGVLNTDNMSIVGLTIDYGPYGFLEFYDNLFISNHSDKYGRYAYSE